MASLCKPSISLGRREEKWGVEDQWLNFRSFLLLGSFPFYFHRFIFLGFLHNFVGISSFFFGLERL